VLRVLHDGSATGSGTWRIGIGFCCSQNKEATLWREALSLSGQINDPLNGILHSLGLATHASIERTIARRWAMRVIRGDWA
jgi:hypothetical protein